MTNLPSDTITHALNELSWARTALADPGAVPDEWLDEFHDATLCACHNHRRILLRRYAITQIDKTIGQLLPLTS